MEIEYKRLTPEIVARNIELVAALCCLPLREQRATLDSIRGTLWSHNGPKISQEDFRAIDDAVGLDSLHEIQKPL